MNRQGTEMLVLSEVREGWEGRRVVDAENVEGKKHYGWGKSEGCG